MIELFGIFLLMMVWVIYAGRADHRLLGSRASVIVSAVISAMTVFVLLPSHAVTQIDDRAEQAGFVGGGALAPWILVFMIALLWRIFSPIPVVQRIRRMSGFLVWAGTLLLIGSIALRTGSVGNELTTLLILGALLGYSLLHFVTKKFILKVKKTDVTIAVFD